MSEKGFHYDWRRAFGDPVVSGVIRSTPDDFVVEEILGFEPAGEGEHQFLKIEKRGENSEWIARQLARIAGVKNRDVSFSGLKDRHAKTTQWFSVYLPKSKQIDWCQIESENVRLLELTRHRKKLRRGTHKANRFCLTIRNLTGEISEIEDCLKMITKQGVPNYFGSQRFGIDGRNIQSAEAMFRGEFKVRDRSKKSFYLSAARSFLFNQLLSKRVTGDNWNKLLPGDLAQFDGAGSYFKVEVLDGSLKERLQAMDLHPTGPLWGKGKIEVGKEVEYLEQSVVEQYPLFKQGLRDAGLEMSRRALRLAVNKLEWHFPQPGVLVLQFELVSGGFATAVLHEILDKEI